MPQNGSPDNGSSRDQSAEISSAPSNEVGPPDSFTRVLLEMREEQQSREALYRKYVETAEYSTHLRRAYESLGIPASFKPGELVQWKTFLKAGEFPHYAAPAVVMETIDPPHETDREGKRLSMPADLLIGYLNGGQDLILKEVYSGRLMSWDDSRESGASS